MQNESQSLFEKDKLNRPLPVFMWLHVGASPTEHCVGDREVRVHQQPSTNLGKNTSTLFLKDCFKIVKMWVAPLHGYVNNIIVL